MAFSALGFGHAVGRPEAQAAYRELLQMRHPDKYAGNEALRRRATEETKQLNTAWQLLKSWFESGSPLGPAEVPQRAPEPSGPNSPAAQGAPPGAPPPPRAARERDRQDAEAGRLKRVALAEATHAAAKLRVGETEREMWNACRHAAGVVAHGGVERSDVSTLESAIARYLSAYRAEDKAALARQAAIGEVGFAVFREVWNGGPLEGSAPEEVLNVLNQVRGMIAARERAAVSRAAEKVRRDATKVAFEEAGQLLRDAWTAACALRLPLSIHRAGQAVVRSVSLGACLVGAGVAAVSWPFVSFWATNISERTWSTLETLALATLGGLIVTLGADRVFPMHVPRRGPPGRA